jgi:hypothetical protein
MALQMGTRGRLASAAYQQGHFLNCIESYSDYSTATPKGKIALPNAGIRLRLPFSNVRFYFSIR